MRWWPPWRVRPREEGGDRPREEGGDVALRADLARARLDLEERDEALRRVRADLDRERAQAAQGRAEAARAEVSRLVDLAGTPLSQLLTLVHMHGTGAADLRVGDVLAVVSRLAAGLEDGGVHALGVLGERTPFDPAHHEPLGAATVEAGAPVVVRFVGFTHSARPLRKAGVEPERADDGQ